MKTLRTFADRMRKQGSRLLQFGTEHRRRIGLAVLTELAMTTPVDEGTARSNWNVALGDSADGPTPAHVPGKGGSTGAANTRAAIAAGTALLVNLTQKSVAVNSAINNTCKFQKNTVS